MSAISGRSRFAFTADELVVTLADAAGSPPPLAWYPRLRDASAAVRGRFDLMPMGIDWPELDEDSALPECCGAAGSLRPRLPRAPPNPTGLRPATPQPEGMG